MASYEILRGPVTKIGRREAELVLSSVKVGDTLLTNVHVPNQGFFDLIEKDETLVIGFHKRRFSNFMARFIEGFALDKKSAYERQMHFNKYGRDVGKNERNTVFYVRNTETGDEIFYKGLFGLPKYSGRILAAGFASIIFPYVQYFGIFLAVYVVFFSPKAKSHYEKMLIRLRES